MARLALSFLIANLIGGLFLWLALRGLPLGDIQADLLRVGPARLALWSVVFSALYLICHGARVVRWYDLVRPLDPNVSPALVHRVSAVGFAAILLLPLRLGELVRPYLLAKKTTIPASGALGTAVVERVIDGLIMTCLLFLTLATYRGDHATEFATAMGSLSALIFGGAMTVCALALWRRVWTVALVRRLFSVVSRRIADKLADMLEAFILGFQALAAGRALGRFFGLTALYWIANATSMWVLAVGCFGFDLSLWDMATVMALLVIGIMFPAGPAMAGNFEFFMTRSMALFVAVDADALGPRVAAFAVLVHLLQLVVIVVPGFLIMWLDPDSRDLIGLAAKPLPDAPDPATPLHAPPDDATRSGA